MGGPVAGLARLERVAESGDLDAFCLRHGVRVLTVFGSTARGEAAPHDLDVGGMTPRRLDWEAVRPKLRQIERFGACGGPTAVGGR